MTMRKLPHLATRTRLGLGGAALLAIGVAGGAGAVSLTRPTVEMAPTIPTAVSHLAASQGVVTVRGRVAEVYGNRFVVQDATGRMLVDAGRGGDDAVQAGSPILVQGRYDNGQLRAHYLVNAAGTVQEVGPPPHGPRFGAGGPPPPPPGGPGAPPPPPPPGGPGAPPPPPPGGAGAPPPPPPPPGAAAPGGPVASPSLSGRMAPPPAAGQAPAIGARAVDSAAPRQ